MACADSQTGHRHFQFKIKFDNLLPVIPPKSEKIVCQKKFFGTIFLSACYSTAATLALFFYSCIEVKINLNVLSFLEFNLAKLDFPQFEKS